jgi:hypothetical protein
MTDFKYTAGNQSGVFSVDEETVLGRMAVEAETKLLVDLEGKGLTITANEKTYLRSRITMAITRDIASKDTVDIGDVKVQGEAKKEHLPQPIPKEKPDYGDQLPPASGGSYYTLTHVNGSKVTRRQYSPEQSIGAMAADIRQIYDLGTFQQVIIFQRINGKQRELSTTTLLRDLSGKDFYWDIRKID